MTIKQNKPELEPTGQLEIQMQQSDSRELEREEPKAETKMFGFIKKTQEAARSLEDLNQSSKEEEQHLDLNQLNLDL